MKILVVHNRYQQKGGEDSVFEAECDLLKAHGHQVEQLLFDNDDIDGLMSQVKAGWQAFYNGKSAAVLEKVINTFQPEIIHVHNFFPVASPAIFHTATKKNIPVVMTLHNYRLICPGAFLYRQDEICELCIKKKLPLQAISNKCYRDSLLQSAVLSLVTFSHKTFGTFRNKVDRYIALTRFAKNKFLDSSLAVPENRFSVKPNFVFDKGFDHDKEDYFVFVGRLSKEKGVGVLLTAFSNSGKKLKIIGTGPLEELVKEYAGKYSNIEFLGFRGNDFIIQTLKKASALIFPSIWYEGFPIVILEALSTGTPVVCSNIGAMPEIIDDGVTGLHFSSGSAVDLEEKVDCLSRNQDLRTTFSVNSRKLYMEAYSPQVNYGQLVSIYRDTISSYSR